MESPLSFNASENFRKKLLIKNLPPFNEGYKPADKPGTEEFNIQDYANTDPGNIEDIGNIEEIKLYTKNKYGPEDILGFGDVKDVNLDKGTESNKGEFEYITSRPSLSSEESRKNASIKNRFLPEEGYTKFISIEDIENFIESRAQYFTFISSTYNPFNILTQTQIVGSNGSLSSDSDLAKIGATQLKTEFEYRLGEEVRQETLGRVNAIDALNDPFDAVAILSGNRSVFEPNYNISVPENIVGKGLDLLSRLSGVYSPYSWINGDYFEPETVQTSEEQASNNSLFGERGILKKNDRKKSSELLLSNTGKGQFKRLFSNLTYNKFRPDYQNVKDSAPEGSYYLGTNVLTVQDIVSPSSQLPIDNQGNKVEIPVAGYGAIGESYENKEASNNFKFGLNGNVYILGSSQVTNSSFDSKRLQGGFVWQGGESKNAGKTPKRGGISAGDVDTTGNVNTLLGSLESYSPTVEIEEGYSSTPKSSSYTFTKGSILDNTQKLIDAAETLPASQKLKHVGNAINQISKVFNDGTREMTKGSMVYKYVRKDNGTYVGTEYCRVFSKDMPYSQNFRLQKTQGAVNENRKFENSVFNNTFNLNISPTKGKESTNILDGSVKKYMFSLENLAWRTSSKKGYTYQDLPVCERGPNKGRIMWFPPYDLKVSENNSVSWNTNNFLGRPEPIFTYGNTVRNGSLSWKIVVDHPSILNVIAEKELANAESPAFANDVIDSFFAGCKTYDMYELATRYPQFSPDDIYEILQEIETIEGSYELTEQIPKVRVKRVDPVIEPYKKEIKQEDYSFFFYFDNDVPGPKDASDPVPGSDYLSDLSTYIGKKGDYESRNTGENKQEVLSFFTDYIDTITANTRTLVDKMITALDNKATINIKLFGSASAPASVAYNETLSQRRLNSVKNYFFSLIDVDKYGDKFTISLEDAQGEDANVFTPNGEGPFTCTDDFATRDEAIYSKRAMACRRVRIDVEEVGPSPDEIEKPEPTFEEETYYEEQVRTVYTSETRSNNVIEQRNDIAKRILRKLLSECNYFEVMKEDSPMVYEGLQSKLKYFQPAFHSTTPEGLNSRLTFLQQCLRPGDTIPVIGEDGKPKKGGIQNTAFGSPPICILRIGDFYHTKIAINQLSINFEPMQYDLNPEGIGIQPMIADVNMSFYFIGGQGLEAPVARLQNALSFNFYGNTEMYDDRAIATEDRSEIDAEVMKVVEDIQQFSVKDGRVQRPEEADNTIGEILTTEYTGQNLSGETKYNAVVRDLVGKTQTYIQGAVNTVQEISTNLSEIGLAYFTKTRKYIYGNMTGSLDNNNPFFINIIGKPVLQQDIENLYSELLLDIENNTNPFLTNISQNDFKNSEIKKFKKNLITYVNGTKANFESNLTSKISDLEKNQLEVVRVIDKLNLILTETDGYRNSRGANTLLELTPTNQVSPDSTDSNTLQELSNDMVRVGQDMQSFYDLLFKDNSFVRNESFTSGYLTGTFDTPEQTRFCTAAYKDIIENPEQVKETLLSNGLKDNEQWVSYINRIIYGVDEVPNNLSSITGLESNTPLVQGIPGLLDKYQELKESNRVRLNGFKNSSVVQKFTTYQPFNLDKERVFTYTQNIQGSVDPTKNGYFNTTFAGQNGGALDKFNLKYSFN